jgi:putative endonuclease
LLAEVDMPYWVYILQNEITGKLYKGQTADLEKRIERHNSYESGSSRYTYKQKGLWRLIYSEEHSNRSEAMKRERFLKSGQGREWIKANVL